MFARAEAVRNARRLLSVVRSVRNRSVALFVSLAFAAAAQLPSHKLVIDTSTPEGELLQQIATQTEDAKKLAAMEQFVSKYPSHEALTWVYGQLQPLYIKTGYFDNALDIGNRLLVIDPRDLDATYNNLKAAEGKKDWDLVVKWAIETSRIARQPEENSALADRAKQMDLYCEYSLYASALQSGNSQKTIALVETLEQINPRSQYLPKVYRSYFNAMRQNGQAEKAGVKAEKMAESNAASPEVLLVAADFELQKKTQPEKVFEYASRLLETLNTQPKPDGVTDAVWAKKKQSMLALGNWMQGVVYSAQGKWLEADKSLRAAVPDTQDQQVRASGLFYLGEADYRIAKMGRDKAWMQEALKFSEQSAAIESPLQTQAQLNVRKIRGELGVK